VVVAAQRRRGHHAHGGGGRFVGHSTTTHGGSKDTRTHVREFDLAKERAVEFRKGRIAGDREQGRVRRSDPPEEHHESRGQLLGDPKTNPNKNQGGLERKATIAKFKTDTVLAGQERMRHAQQMRSPPRPGDHVATVDPRHPDASQAQLDFENHKRHELHNQMLDRQRKKRADEAAANESIKVCTKAVEAERAEMVAIHDEMAKKRAAVEAARAAEAQAHAERCQAEAELQAAEAHFVAEAEAEAEDVAEEAPGIHSKYDADEQAEIEAAFAFAYDARGVPFYHNAPMGPPPFGYHPASPAYMRYQRATATKDTKDAKDSEEVIQNPYAGFPYAHPLGAPSMGPYGYPAGALYHPRY